MWDCSCGGLTRDLSIGEFGYMQGAPGTNPPRIRMIVLLLLLLFDAVTIFILQSGERWRNLLMDLRKLRGRTGYRTGSKLPQLCHTQHITGPLTIQSVSLYSLGEQDGHCQCVCKNPKHQKHWGLKKQLCKDASVTVSEKICLLPYSHIPLKS